MTNRHIALALSLALPACTFDVKDLNRPAVDQILGNPTSREYLCQCSREPL